MAAMQRVILYPLHDTLIERESTLILMRTPTRLADVASGAGLPPLTMPFERVAPPRPPVTRPLNESPDWLALRRHYTVTHDVMLMDGVISTLLKRVSWSIQPAISLLLTCPSLIRRSRLRVASWWARVRSSIAAARRDLP